MKRVIGVVAGLLLAGAALGVEDGYSVGVIVDADQSTELRSSGMFGGGVQDANANTITVDLDGMRYTVDYQTLLAGGKNASSRFVVGSEIHARVHNGKWLWILREDGKPLRARITRREIVVAR